MPIQTAIDSISNNQGSPFGFKNRIINGGMVIDQRNAGASITPTTDGTFSVDRWRCGLSVTSKFSVQQNAGSVTRPVGFSNYLGVTSLSSYTVGASENFRISQSIEGFNTADLGWGTANAQTVTLSFWVRSSLTGTFGGVIKNSAENRVYPFTYTISSANTWEYETITIPGDTTGTWVGATNGNGLSVHFSLGTGATASGTAGAWAAGNLFSATGATSVVGTNGATFYITGVQLEEGTQATPFDYRPIGTELQLCQRYYQIVTSGCGRIATTTSILVGVAFSPTMRSAPAIALKGVLRNENYAGTNGTITGVTTTVSTVASGCQLILAVSGMTGTPISPSATVLYGTTDLTDGLAANAEL